MSIIDKGLHHFEIQLPGQTKAERFTTPLQNLAAKCRNPLEHSQERQQNLGPSNPWSFEVSGASQVWLAEMALAGIVVLPLKPVRGMGRTDIIKKHWGKNLMERLQNGWWLFLSCKSKFCLIYSFTRASSQS